MFVDQVDVEVQAGDGGNGAVTFRREKYVPRGGPDGGDGARGGNVVLVYDANLSTLLDFRYRRLYRGERGGDGRAKNMSGKGGEDLLLAVPGGTTVTDRESGAVIADITPDTPRAIVAYGGSGGKGNAHFVTSVQQAPKFGENGEAGEHRLLRLELRVLADVGLLGFPSVGKSTLIAAISAARPKIADYPFTTLVPNLGVVEVEPHRTMVVADLPGLIEGAHEGAGLGLQFLRHVERTRIVIHMLDVSSMTGRDPLEDFEILNREVRLHSDRLADLPQIVALNKIDAAPDPDEVEALASELRGRGLQVFAISAAAHMGLKPLIFAAWTALQEARIAQPDPEPIVILRTEPTRRMSVRDTEIRRDADGAWVLAGAAIERMVRRTDLNNDHAVRRLQRIMDRGGLYTRLKEMGAKEGDTVQIGPEAFEYRDEDGEDDEE